uniref:Uncharacterized protein n=1 Tax=Anguilla anguilla TaxID=7936 RepID=A0A0E9Q607_ANGAN
MYMGVCRLCAYELIGVHALCVFVTNQCLCVVYMNVCLKSNHCESVCWYVCF